MSEMTREQAIEALKELQHEADPEATHTAADAILCRLLIGLGCGDVVAEFKKVPRWYA